MWPPWGSSENFHAVRCSPRLSISMSPWRHYSKEASAFGRRPFYAAQIHRATHWKPCGFRISPGMLPPLGILFALQVGFIAVEVWNNYDKAKVAVATEASALRALVLLAGTFPEEQKTRIYALVDRHIEVAVNEGWPAMAQRRMTLSTLPTSLIE